MSENTESTMDSLKELDDIEFEILFVDNIYKKLKSLDKPDLRLTTLLFMYMSVVEATKKYRDLAKDGNRTILHEDILNVILNKGESFLSSVASNEEKSLYVYQSLAELRDWVKDLLLVLKKELLESPTYAHLKKT